jgi:excisionase family DNA binding protein
VATRTEVRAVPVRLLSTIEVAELLQVPVKTIYEWRLRGQGPRSVRVGRHLRFDPSDLCRWIEDRKSGS